MSELSCDTPFIGQIGALDLVRNRYKKSYAVAMRPAANICAAMSFTTGGATALPIM